MGQTEQELIRFKPSPRDAKEFEPYEHLFAVNIGGLYAIKIPEGYEVFQITNSSINNRYDIWFTNNEKVRVKAQPIDLSNPFGEFDFNSFGEVIKQKNDNNKAFRK